MGVDETVLPALSLALSLMNLLEEPTRRGCNWWAPVAASEVATTHCGQSGNLQRRGGLPAGRGGKLPLAAGGISLAVVGRRRDLVSVPVVAGRRRDPLVSDGDDGRRRKGWSWNRILVAAQRWRIWRSPLLK